MSQRCSILFPSFHLSVLTNSNKISKVHVPLSMFQISQGSIFHLHDPLVVKIHSLVLYAFESLCFAYLLVLEHPYIENVIWPACQNSQAHAFSLTLFPVAVNGVQVSPINSCNCCSTLMYLHTSLMSDDVMFLTRLCRNDTKPTFFARNSMMKVKFFTILTIIWKSCEWQTIKNLNKIPEEFFYEIIFFFC